MRRLTEHFPVSEAACKDGTPLPESLYDDAQEFAESVLEKIRARLNRKYAARLGHEITMRRVSWWRTPQHNAKSGGAKDSWHLKARAYDFTCPGLPVHVVHAEIELMIYDGELPEIGLGLYKNFVHVDNRGYRRRGYMGAWKRGW